MADESSVDLVAAVLTREATRTRGDAGSPYSWGAVLRVAPGHARETAAAVLAALRGAGRLVTAERLAEWGRAGWAWGWAFGALFVMCAERFDWPWWLALPVGAVSFYVGPLVIGWAARRAAGRDGGNA